MLRTTFELSIEEVELLLDLLGPPSEQDSAEKKHLRQRLQEVLLFIRQKNSVPTDTA